MEIQPIKTEEDYQAALKEIDRIFQSEPGTPEGDRGVRRPRRSRVSLTGSGRALVTVTAGQWPAIGRRVAI